MITLQKYLVHYNVIAVCEKRGQVHVDDSDFRTSTHYKFHPSADNTKTLEFIDFGQLFTAVYTLLLRAQHRDLARYDLITNVSFCIVLNQCITFTFGKSFNIFKIYIFQEFNEFFYRIQNLKSQQYHDSPRA